MREQPSHVACGEIVKWCAVPHVLLIVSRDLDVWTIVFGSKQCSCRGAVYSGGTWRYLTTEVSNSPGRHPAMLPPCSPTSHMLIMARLCPADHPTPRTAGTPPITRCTVHSTRTISN